MVKDSELVSALEDSAWERMYSARDVLTGEDLGRVLASSPDAAIEALESRQRIQRSNELVRQTKALLGRATASVARMRAAMRSR